MSIALALPMTARPRRDDFSSCAECAVTNTGQMDSEAGARRRRAETRPAGADIVVAMHYKKTLKYEGQAMTDRKRGGNLFRR